MALPLLALAFAAAGSAAPAAGRSLPVPILMYHVLAVPPAGAPYPGLYVRPSDFHAQVRALARAGYHGVTLRQVFEFWRGHGRLPAKPIVLSFDDGYLGDLTVARPELRAVGWPGVLNLQVGNLAPPRVRTLIAAGWEIDAHTITHPDLTRVDPARLWLEVNGSRERIRSTYHVPVLFFCYPGGHYDAAVVAVVRRAGYWGATTTNPGLARPSDPYTLDRIRVGGGESAATLVAGLAALSRG